VGPGPASTIDVQVNQFLTFEAGSSTTLNSDLELLGNNIIVKAGATFAGGGALVIPNGSHVVTDNLANIGVLVDMQGALRPGNSEGIGRAQILDFQQGPTSKLFLELTGTGLNQYDRLVVDGVAQLDGYLNIDIDGGFVPALDNSFIILTAAARTGEFDYFDVSGMPAGLAFHIEYLAGSVVLKVVEEAFFEADFDSDGDVDITDYTIWRNAYGLNQLGDANGDNLSNAADYVIWRNQLGAKSLPGAGALASARVPEPATWLWLALAGVTCSVARRYTRTGTAKH
jgi:hypothetical protein